MNTDPEKCTGRPTRKHACPKCCDRCNYDMHICGGCGSSIGHGQGICADCEFEIEESNDGFLYGPST